jgi:hypothetical protein
MSRDRFVVFADADGEFSWECGLCHAGGHESTQWYRVFDADCHVFGAEHPRRLRALEDLAALIRLHVAEDVREGYWWLDWWLDNGSDEELPEAVAEAIVKAGWRPPCKHERVVHLADTSHCVECGLS